MESTVLDLKKALGTSLERKKYHSACDILDRLLEIKATKELLKKTEIGIYATRLKKHSEKDIAQRATKLLDKWKRDVGIVPKPPVPPTENPGSLPKTPSVPSDLPNVDSTSSLSTETSTVASGKDRSAQSDGVVLPTLGNKIREKCVELMYNALSVEADEDTDEILRIAIQLELALFKKHVGQVSPEYKMELRMYSSSLKNKGNGTLRRSLLNEAIAPSELVVMTAAELASEELKKKLHEVKKKNLFLAQGATNIKAVTDQFRCGKCKKRKCSYFQMQTRSADEPMTTFVECLECGHNWKFC